MVAIQEDKNGFARFGVARDPVNMTDWLNEDIPEDPTLSQITFQVGMISFAANGKPKTRPTDVSIVMPDVSQNMLRVLGHDNPWETPFGFIKNVNHTAMSEWFGYDDNDWPDFGTINENESQFEKEKNTQTNFIEGCIVVRDADYDNM